MEWAEALNNPFLQDLPFKIELNKWGQILMTPASNRHGILQSEVVYLLRSRLPGGVVIVECSIQTSDGVKVVDVAWASDEFLERNGETTPYQEAPEICVEIVSPSNSPGEIEQTGPLKAFDGKSLQRFGSLLPKTYSERSLNSSFFPRFHC